MWFIQRYKESRILVFSGLKILLQMYFGAGIEINDSLFVTFAKDNALALIKVHIRTIELYQLPDAHSGG